MLKHYFFINRLSSLIYVIIFNSISNNGPKCSFFGTSFPKKEIKLKINFNITFKYITGIYFELMKKKIKSKLKSFL